MLIFVPASFGELRVAKFFEISVIVPEIKALRVALEACDLEKNAKVGGLFTTEVLSYLFQERHLLLGQVWIALVLSKLVDCTVRLDRVLWQPFA